MSHGTDRGRNDPRHLLTVRFQLRDPAQLEAVVEWAQHAGLEVVVRRRQTVVVCSSTAAVEAALQIRIHDFEWLGAGGARRANIDAPTIPSHLAIERIDGLHVPYVEPSAEHEERRYSYVRRYELG